MKCLYPFLGAVLFIHDIRSPLFLFSCSILYIETFLEVEGLEEVEVWVSLYGILFDSTWTTVDSKDGAVGVGGYDGTWLTGEWSGAGRVNGASGQGGEVNG